MKRLMLCSIVALFSLLVVLPNIFPVFAQISIQVVCQVRDLDSDGYPDIIFTATNALGQPQGGVAISVTPDGSPGPLYTGSTDPSGTFILKDVPTDKYIWSSEENNGIVEINPSDYPIVVSNQVAHLASPFFLT